MKVHQHIFVSGGHSVAKLEADVQEKRGFCGLFGDEALRADIWLLDWLAVPLREESVGSCGHLEEIAWFLCRCACRRAHATCTTTSMSFNSSTPSTRSVSSLCLQHHRTSEKGRQHPPSFSLTSSEYHRCNAWLQFRIAHRRGPAPSSTRDGRQQRLRKSHSCHAQHSCFAATVTDRFTVSVWSRPVQSSFFSS